MRLERSSCTRGTEVHILVSEQVLEGNRALEIRATTTIAGGNVVAGSEHLIRVHVYSDAELGEIFTELEKKLTARALPTSALVIDLVRESIFAPKRGK